MNKLLKAAFTILVFVLQVFALKTLFNAVIAPALLAPALSFWQMFAISAFVNGVIQNQFIAIASHVMDTAWGPHQDPTIFPADMKSSAVARKMLVLCVGVLSALAWLAYAWLLGS